MKIFGLLLISIWFLACFANEQVPLAGEWVASDKHDGQTDDYHLTIKDSHTKLTGRFSSRMDGAKLPEIVIDRIDYKHPNFTLTIKTGGIEILYSGTISDDANTLIGQFQYSNPDISPKTLVFTRNKQTKALKTDFTYKQPASNVFPTASLTDVEMQQKIMENLLGKISNGEFGEINSFLVIKDGKLVVEEYYNGFQANQLQQLQSCTKSIISLLIGIAIDNKMINSVDDKVLQFFPGLEHSSGWSDVTIRQLLTMSSGMEWADEDSHSPLANNPDIEAILKKPIVAKPGTEFNYNSAMQLLGGILVKATGMDLEDFAGQYLFRPLDIKDYLWQKNETDNIPICTGALKLRSLDMAKIGILVLNSGKYNMQKVISASWISESVKQQIEVPRNKGDNYGYLWWVNSKDRKMIYAHGMGGQFIFIIPDYNLVIVTTGNNFTEHQLAPFKIVRDYILKSIKNPK